MMPSHRSFSVFSVLLAAAVVGAHAHADAPPRRFELRGDVAYDTRSKLGWQRGTAPEAYSSLAAARAYCSGLDLDGTGFRVPTLRELATIVDTSRNNPAIDLSVFPNTSSGIYWSSTAIQDRDNPQFPPASWGMFFDFGSSRRLDTSADSVPLATYHVRCVR
jgi:hypothetical protein